MQSGFLEGGTVVNGVHFGPYDALAESYVAFEKWLEKAGFIQSRSAQGLKFSGDFERQLLDRGPTSKRHNSCCWPGQQPGR